MLEAPKIPERPQSPKFRTFYSECKISIEDVYKAKSNNCLNNFEADIRHNLKQGLLYQIDKHMDSILSLDIQGPMLHDGLNYMYRIQTTIKMPDNV